MTKLKGQNIKQINTIATMYNNQCINVYDDKNNHYLMKLQEVMKFKTDFNQVIFNIIQKRKHKYLEVE